MRTGEVLGATWGAAALCGRPHVSSGSESERTALKAALKKQQQTVEQLTEGMNMMFSQQQKASQDAELHRAETARQLAAAEQQRTEDVAAAEQRRKQDLARRRGYRCACCSCHEGAFGAT